ncbi:B12-binding domain-containing radical SAM protein [[Eubacterium] cellulosolvens]
MPLLSQMYIASSLLNSGYDVKIIDLNAKYFQYNFEKIVSEIKAYEPNAICMSLYTPTARFVYEFVSQLKSIYEFSDCLLIAGGPHPTAVPEEPLKYGFDVVVRGEGEQTILELMDYIEGKTVLKKIKGLSYNTSTGEIHHCAPRTFIKNLDSIPLSVNAIPLFDPSWYLENGSVQNLPAGLITSRGCPSRCTYCANIVTGRRFRFRSLENVLGEMKYYNTTYGTTFFSFWDDSFTSNITRVSKLCGELIRLKQENKIEFQWSCITRADGLTVKLVKEMVNAGCISISFGVESGSPETLAKIKKDLNLKQVVKSLKWCKTEGLGTQVNFMLGFPWEREKHLQDTLDFMVKINDLVDAYSARGVVIPYPGTELYEKSKDQYDLDNWWLRKKMDINDKFDELRDIYLKDPILELDLFKYSYGVKKMIQKCLEYKGEQTMAKLGI